jgi:hypothetical protein
MQEAQDSIVAICKWEKASVTATLVIIVKQKRKVSLMLLINEGSSLWDVCMA